MAAYNFRCSVHYHHGRNHSICERCGIGEIAESPTFLQATGSLLRSWAWETSKPNPIVTHFLQQGHAHSNKVTSPNSTIPYEIMGSNYIQTATELVIDKLFDLYFYQQVLCEIMWVC